MTFVTCGVAIAASGRTEQNSIPLLSIRCGVSCGWSRQDLSKIEWAKRDVLRPTRRLGKRAYWPITTWLYPTFCMQHHDSRL
jgi:hypothetical protein